MKDAELGRRKRGYRAGLLALFLALGLGGAFSLAWARCGVAGCPDARDLAAYQPGGAPVLLDRHGGELASLHPLECRVVSLDSAGGSSSRAMPFPSPRSIRGLPISLQTSSKKPWTTGRVTAFVVRDSPGLPPERPEQLRKAPTRGSWDIPPDTWRRSGLATIGLGSSSLVAVAAASPLPSGVR